MTSIRRCLLIMAIVALAAPACIAQQDTATLAWRLVGSYSNTVVTPGSLCFAGADGEASGSCVPGKNEGYWLCRTLPGSQTVATADSTDAWPAIISAIKAQAGGTVCFDIPVKWLYEADNLVRSQPFVEAGQTFIATGDELEKVSCRVAGGPDTFDVYVKKDGPSGAQVGQSAGFTTSETGWGTACWRPGDVPLEIGQTYYIGIKCKSAKPFAVCLHSTGETYPGGTAFFDGVPEPASDLGLRIALQSSDTTASSVLQTMNREGWVLHSRGVYFKARSANVRSIRARVKFKGSPDHLSTVIKLYRLEPSGAVTPIGKEKQCAADRDGDGTYFLAATYGKDDAPVEIGKTYYLEVTPAGVTPAPRLDLLVSVYGEKAPGLTPVMFNQHISGATSTSVTVAWEGTKDCSARVDYGLSPYKLGNSIQAPKGAQEVEIHPISPGMAFDFRITLANESGGVFQSPVYQARTRDTSNKVVADPPLPATPMAGFISLARMDNVVQPPKQHFKIVDDLQIPNSSFETSLTGWKTTGANIARFSVTGQPGTFCAGLGSAGAGCEEAIHQQVEVTPGTLYLLFASLLTDESDSGASVTARLVCDPKGGTDFAGHNSTQWFRTQGQWLEFEKKWKAESDTMTIGAVFSRAQDSSNALALVRAIHLQEVKEPPTGLGKMIQK